MTEDDARTWFRSQPGVDAAAVGRAERLIALLTEENARQNLVAGPTVATVWTRHIVDSAQLVRWVPRGTGSWIDLGSGAGFPGLVVAIMHPAIRVTLVEARPRRVDWLARAGEALGLANLAIAGCRLEQLETQAFDVISARAFAPLPRLVALAARFSTSDTVWVLPKGRSAGQELRELVGWRHTFHVEQSLTDPEAGVIVGALLGKEGKRL